ncbi:MAG TPA: Gfo/Idh/MocA family oxidoreductase, partial [Chloroflexota bacterium]|nr:Gfo/Idh/MocA family oxidoreductase [Chloroflexota bacterium]
ESVEDWKPVELELRDPFGVQIEDFLAGIVRGQPTTPDWQDAVTNQRLIKAAYRSAAERREVSLKEIRSPAGVSR